MQGSQGSQLSPEQLAIRATGITATDIAAIVGQHPYRSAIDVWRDKMGISAPFAGNDRTKWGNLLEPVIRADYAERKGVRVETRGTLRGEGTSEWMIATPDGLVYRPGDVQPERGLEIKCHTIYLAKNYGQPGTDEVPFYELCQCAWGMAVTGLQAWDLVPFIDGQTRDYTIARDEELIGMLRENAERFKRDHVDVKVPPPPDGSDAYDQFLAARHGKNKGTMVRISDDDSVMESIWALHDIKRQINALEALESIKVQDIKARIGDADGLEWGPAKKPEKITWKLPKASSYVDGQALIADLQGGAGVVLSAVGDIAERAIVALDKMAETHFENTRATVEAKQVRQAIQALLDHAREVHSDAALERHTYQKAVSRKFDLPYSWRKSTKAGE